MVDIIQLTIISERSHKYLYHHHHHHHLVASVHQSIFNFVNQAPLQTSNFVWSTVYALQYKSTLCYKSTQEVVQSNKTSESLSTSFIHILNVLCQMLGYLIFLICLIYVYFLTVQHGATLIHILSQGRINKHNLSLPHPSSHTHTHTSRSGCISSWFNLIHQSYYTDVIVCMVQMSPADAELRPKTAAEHILLHYHM